MGFAACAAYREPSKRQELPCGSVCASRAPKHRVCDCPSSLRVQHQLVPECDGLGSPARCGPLTPILCGNELLFQETEPERAGPSASVVVCMLKTTPPLLGSQRTKWARPPGSTFHGFVLIAEETRCQLTLWGENGRNQFEEPHKYGSRIFFGVGGVSSTAHYGSSALSHHRLLPRHE